MQGIEIGCSAFNIDVAIAVLAGISHSVNLCRRLVGHEGHTFVIFARNGTYVHARFGILYIIGVVLVSLFKYPGVVGLPTALVRAECVMSFPNLCTHVHLAMLQVADEECLAIEVGAKHAFGRVQAIDCGLQIGNGGFEFGLGGRCRSGQTVNGIRSIVIEVLHAIGSLELCHVTIIHILKQGHHGRLDVCSLVKCGLHNRQAVAIIGSSPAVNYATSRITAFCLHIDGV